MPEEEKRVLEKLRRLPFPKLGKQIGDFPLYDSLLAGVADRYIRGRPVDRSEIPEPDLETLDAVAALRAKAAADLSEEEKQFLEYYEHMEHVRGVLLG
jgi:hypothetical protein